MPNKGQSTGMRGVYLVASELSRLGLTASPTSRSAIGADILVTNQECTKAFSVQVKSNATTFNFWLLNKNASTSHSKSHVYVFVNIRSRKDKESIEYYIVPSRVVAENVRVSKRSKSIWYAFDLNMAKRYKDKWSVFE